MSHSPLPSHHAIHTGGGFGAKSFSQMCAMMPAARASPRTLVMVRSRSLRRDSQDARGGHGQCARDDDGFGTVCPHPECPSCWCCQVLGWFCRCREKMASIVSLVLGQHLSHPACVSSAGACQWHLPNCQCTSQTGIGTVVLSGGRAASADHKTP